MCSGRSSKTVLFTPLVVLLAALGCYCVSLQLGFLPWCVWEFCFSVCSWVGVGWSVSLTGGLETVLVMRDLSQPALNDEMTAEACISFMCCSKTLLMCHLALLEPFSYCKPVAFCFFPSSYVSMLVSWAFQLPTCSPVLYWCVNNLVTF